MEFTCNPSFLPVLRASRDVRYFHLRGGRGRGGSFFATDYALACLIEPVYFRCYLMRAVHKDIRESLWRDLMDRMQEKEQRGELNMADFKINHNEMSVTHLATKNTIRSRGFRKSSSTSTARLKSLAGATHVIIEEAEEIEEADFNQLDDSLRTIKAPIQIFMVFNPPKKNHWIHTRWYNLVESAVPGYYLAVAKNHSNFLSVFSTYHHNRANLSQQFVDNLENYRWTNEEHYYTVVRGLISEGSKGRIYKKWKPITQYEFDQLPYSYYYVLDFGFSIDPTAMAMVKRSANKRYANELIYEKELTTPALIRRLKQLRVGNRPIVAESANPTIIQELRDAKFNIVKAKKGPDSVRQGIKKMQGLEWHYTEESKNLAYEYQEYKWEFNADKDQTDQPIDKHNHIMDGLRYGELTDPWGGGSIEHR